MRVAFIVFGVAGLLLGATLGCDGNSSASKPKIKAGWSPTPRYDQYQTTCPVCGNGIKEEHYVDVETGEGSKRLYFDSEECVEKFKEDREKYLEKYKDFQEQTEEARPASPFGNQQQ